MTKSRKEALEKAGKEYPPQELYPLKDFEAPRQAEPFYDNYQLGVPIALDLGTSSFKIGLTNSDKPNNVYPSIVSRYRDRKASQTLTIIGNDIYRDQSLRTSLKAPFDGPLIINWDYIEFMLDYSFEHLGVNSDNGRVNNPIIMTEPVCCPSAQRKNMYELLFEAYRAPKVVFGIDSLFSYYANRNSSKSTGVVIGMGHELTHMIPVIEGKGILLQTKRVDWGGDQCQHYIQRLLSLKYPYFPTRITPQYATNIFQDHCYVLRDYQYEAAHYLDMDFLETHDVVLQAPFEISQTNEKKKSSEELARQAQKKKEQGKRLQEQAQQKRAEKLQQKEQEWTYYSNLMKEFEGSSEKDIQRRLEEEEFEGLSDFKKYLNSLERSLKRAQGVELQSPEDTNLWPLVDIPDSELSDSQIKEKRRQKLLKHNQEARERAKEEKMKAEKEKEDYEREQEEWRANNLEEWCEAQRAELTKLYIQIKEREKLLNSFKDRKSMAAQQRMKNIADLANDETGSTSAASRKRRRNANTTIDNDPNDTFGANDEDWSVYREITDTGLMEEQNEDYEKVSKLEDGLLKYDPNFHYEDTLESAQNFDWKNLTLHKFIHGPRPNITIAMQAEITDPDELADHPDIIKKNHQMHFNIERIRVPEIYFEPNMAGLDQAGIIELLSDLFCKRMDGNFNPGGVSYNLIQDVFLTGGVSKLPGMVDRMYDIRASLPIGAPLKVRLANDPILDAWKGMQKWSTSEECNKSYVSLQEYEEMGSEYIKEHGLGNICLM